MGTRISARPDWPLGPTSLLCNGYWFLPGGRGGRGVGLTPTPSSAEDPRKRRAIPLLVLRACVAYKRVKPHVRSFIVGTVIYIAN